MNAANDTTVALSTDERVEILLLRVLERRVRQAGPSVTDAVAISLAALDSLRNDRKVTR